MNILILNWKDIKNPEVGGAEVIAFEFARRLSNDGHTVTFFCRSFTNGVEEETINGVKIIRQGNRYSVYIRAFFYYQNLTKKPDLVIDMVNTLCWMTPLYVPNNKRLLYVNQLAKEVLFYELPSVFSHIAYFAERYEYIFYRKTKTICYSESTKNDLISFGINAKQIFTFTLGLDHTRYRPSPKKSAIPLFIFVARLVKMKRADLCILAMREVVKEYKKAKLIILGNGPEEDNLEKFVSRHRMGKHIEIIGKNNFFTRKTPKDQKVKYMQKAWALLLPSVKEGWGMVVTEAAACATPSIVSNVTGLRDSVKNNSSGIILSKNPSVGELAEAIKALIKNTVERKRLSQGAHRWSKNFNWDKSYKQFRDVVLTYDK